MLSKTYFIIIDEIKYDFELIGDRLYYVPKQGKNISISRLNNEIIEVPQILVITRTKGIPLFALKPDKNDEKQFAILSAKQLYNNFAYQWFEPLADNYRKLIWINAESFNQNSAAYSAYKHFSWKDIIKFALTDRNMSEYAPKKSGDWKYVKNGAAEYLLVMVNNKPYWSDAIGQIPFSVNCMRKYIKKYDGNYSTAIKKTINRGMEFGGGYPWLPDKSNSYDNYIILRGCLWSRNKFQYIKNIDDIGQSYLEITSDNFEYILDSEILKSQRNEYAQWDYSKK